MNYVPAMDIISFFRLCFLHVTMVYLSLWIKDLPPSPRLRPPPLTPPPTPPPTPSPTPHSALLSPSLLSQQTPPKLFVYLCSSEVHDRDYHLFRQVPLPCTSSSKFCFLRLMRGKEQCVYTTVQQTQWLPAGCSLPLCVLSSGLAEQNLSLACLLVYCEWCVTWPVFVLDVVTVWRLVCGEMLCFQRGMCDVAGELELKPRSLRHTYTHRRWEWTATLDTVRAETWSWNISSPRAHGRGHYFTFTSPWPFFLPNPHLF